MILYNPIVSIIVPAYNAEKYITETIQSVLDQTFTDWELLVIDDGSKDSTAKIVKSFSDTRIILIQQENGGVSSARNRGIDISKGKYITFLDADDAIPDFSIGDRVNYLDNHNDIDAVHGNISIRDETLQYESKFYRPFSYQNLLKMSLHLDNRMFFTPGYMIRKDKLDNMRFKEGMTHAEDVLFLITLCSHNITFGYIPKTMYHYRVTNISAMSNMEGWRQGYFDLLNNLKEVPFISYTDTIVMRIKIARMLMSWHLKSRNIVGLIDIFKIFK